MHSLTAAAAVRTGICFAVVVPLVSCRVVRQKSGWRLEAMQTSRRLVRIIREARLALVCPEVLGTVVDVGQGSTMGRIEARGLSRRLVRPERHAFLP